MLMISVMLPDMESDDIVGALPRNVSAPALVVWKEAQYGPPWR
jgi:hypothetical protein